MEEIVVNLRVPGPTPCPEDILLAGAQQMINHRGPEFSDIIQRVHSGLQRVFQTENQIAILTSSGTGAMEAAIVNTLSPGDRILMISIGVFGDRFCQIAEAYGVEIVKPDFPYGSFAKSEVVEEILAEDPSIKAVAVTHNETSTGVTNDLESLAGIIKRFDKLLLVDAISSLGCLPLETDTWGCDVVMTASQKGFMVPPGLAFVSVSPRAIEASKSSRIPRFYLDFERHLSYFQRGQTPWTPAVSILVALDKALEKMLGEGMEAIYLRHVTVANQTRLGVKALGLELFSEDENYASNSVTAVKVPEGVDARSLLNILRTEHDVVLAGGQGPAMEGKVFRIGHLGFVSEEDIRGVLTALEIVLPQVGFALAKA
jgi:aspartate aminotransferase-like enzyme